MIEDIVVHLTGSKDDGVRLGYAGPIAALLGHAAMPVSMAH